MSYMQGGYRQPDLRPGMSVQTDTGWGGQIVEVIPAQPGYDSMVRVAWHGYGTTDVAASTFTVENGVAWIRSQPPAQPEPQPQRPAPQPAATDEAEMATQLAAPARPMQQEPSHVNPYVTDPPLVTNEPAPIHAADVQPERQHVSPYLDDAPVVASEPPPVRPLGGGQMDAHAAAPAYGASDEAGRLQPAAPPAEPASEPAAATTPLAVPAEQQEIVVPIIEERVAASAEWRDAGAINVRKVMDEEPLTLTQETQRDEVFVERVAVGRVLDAGEEVAPREEEGVYIVPVVVEEAVVVTRRVLVEELRLTKRSVTTMQTLQTVVRRERVEIDGGALTDRIHDADATGTDAASGPTHAPHGETGT